MKIIKIIARIVVTPLVFCTVLVSALIMTFLKTYDFLVYGGELITFNKYFDKDNVKRILDELDKQKLADL